MSYVKPRIAVHGGAWSIPDDLVKPYLDGVKRAADLGLEVLKSGGSALDAVERAVSCLEDDPAFDAGVGSFLNEEGFVELDAIIVDGKTLKFGSVASVRRVKNPVRLARLVMERTEFHMFVSAGAERLAEKFGLGLVDPSELIVERELERWKNLQKEGKKPSYIFSTVGAVAIDSNGDLAAATSTGGLPNKMVGRVGDSPLIGCGAYADNSIGAASATGHGESTMRVLLSKLAVDLIPLAGHPKSAAEVALKIMKERTGGLGGLILIDSAGRFGYAHTTKRMALAYSDGQKIVALVSESRRANLKDPNDQVPR